MQRIGRVNRIGTTAKKIYIYNFYPTAQVNSQIELENKAKLKLFAFHSALGEDSGIYSPDETPETFGLFDRAIEEERDERLQFLSILRDFKDENPDELSPHQESSTAGAMRTGHNSRRPDQWLARVYPQ